MQNLVYLAAIPFNQRWKIFSTDGIQTAILGILAVFAVLSILWGCLEIFKYVFYTLPERRKAEANGEKAQPVAESAPEAEEESYADDGTIVAAIIAAITAARAEEGASAPAAFRVVSFRKRK
jgi:sodium pump decarboxylase gamma subunit